MHDAHAGRHHAEVGKRALAPPQELIAFAIPLELEVDVRLQRVGAAEAIHLHRMVDDQVDRDERIDPLRITAQALHRAAHGGQIHDGRYSGEVLQHDARRRKRNLDLGQIGRRPGGQMPHVVVANHVTVAVAGHGFEQNADGERQAGHGPHALFFQTRQAVDAHRPSRGLNRVSNSKRIRGRCRVTHNLLLYRMGAYLSQDLDRGQRRAFSLQAAQPAPCRLTRRGMGRRVPLHLPQRFLIIRSRDLQARAVCHVLIA